VVTQIKKNQAKPKVLANSTLQSDIPFNSENTKINVMVADKSLSFRNRVGTLIKSLDGFEHTAEATSFEETLSKVKALKPDVLLLDQFLVSALIAENIQELISHCDALKILIHFQNQDTHLAISCLRSGAVGMLAKNQNNKTIIKAITCVFNGELWVNRSLITQILKEDFAKKIMSELSVKNPLSSLTPREKVIAQLAAQGNNSKKIASQLAISVKTVSNQLTVIYSKLGIKNQIGLILLIKD
jgi:DNA-binding NarL/FixJ family response regulator